MNAFRRYLTAFFCFLFVTSQAQLTVNGYSNYTLVGFNVLVEDAAMTTNSTLTNAALALLETKLTEISQFNIAQSKLDSLMAVPIFMDWNTTTGAAQYHPSEAWLIANGYAPEKAGCVEISNITNFINWTNQNQPYMVMHELAHAYHHRVLNFNSPLITSAYNNAVSTNLYTSVLYHSGGGNYSTQPTSYALTNDKEYFAEISEAYFGLNDYFPFDYSDLSTYDPEGFNAAFTIWGDLTLSQSSAEISAPSVTVFPNPSSGIFTLAKAESNNKTLSFEILDRSGRTIVQTSQLDDKTMSIDLSDQPSGTYFIRLRTEACSETIQLMKH